jgi:hypothetical protein
MVKIQSYDGSHGVLRIRHEATLLSNLWILRLGTNLRCIGCRAVLDFMDHVADQRFLFSQRAYLMPGTK